MFDGFDAEIDLGAWKLPPVFAWLQREAGLPEAEMLRTFNCGIGMTLVVAKDGVAEVENILSSVGENPIRIGEIFEPEAGGERVVMQGSLGL